MAKRSKRAKRFKRGMGSIYLRGRIWWIGYWRNGKCFAESSKSQQMADALELLKQRQGEIVTGRFAGGAANVRVGDLLEAVVEDYRQNERRSLLVTEQRMRRHVSPFFAKLRAAKFETGHAKNYIKKRASQDASNATINRELAILKRAFRLAARSDPPLVGHVPYIPTLKENNVRTGFVEDEQYLALRHQLPEYLRLLLVIAYYTGVRKGELLKIGKEQVDRKAAQIRLNPGETKNDEGRVLPIYGDMGPWLEIQLATLDVNFPGCRWLFHENGRQILSFRKAWASACERAKVPGQLFHDLRRSAVRNMERAGIPRSVAMKISGHKTEAVYQRYAIVSARDMREAGAKLNRFFEEQRTTAKTTTLGSLEDTKSRVTH
jgi:integrase